MICSRALPRGTLVFPCFPGCSTRAGSVDRATSTSSILRARERKSQASGILSPMKRIYKYPLPITAMPNQTVALPTGARVLSVGVQGSQLFVWALVDTEVRTHTSRAFDIVGTGWDADHVSEKHFVGTVFLAVENGLVFHVFIDKEK